MNNGEGNFDMEVVLRINFFVVLAVFLNLRHVRCGISPGMVPNWASKLGVELSAMAASVTEKKMIQEGYSSKEVQSRKGEDLLQEIAWSIQNMTESKISAVKRIADSAENTAQSHQEDDVQEFEYYNVKNLTNTKELPEEEVPEGRGVMELKSNKHFYDMEVNTTFSAIHVPTNVYDKAPDLLRAVKWSETLDSIFINNFQTDPSLSWQYFGSSIGFMRQYPAAKWKLPEDIDVDLYDCRTRPWYIEAATSPKDMVILVDNSGSMTGMRREIARHVVNDILDTLGPNDFVNVFNFSENSTNVVPCFEGGLVQATLENIRELKQGMEDLFTDKIANFSDALLTAFDLLQNCSEERRGSCCDKAIMLITDGIPYSYEEIFREYNWRNYPFMPVRVFTYLIGKEVADVREVKWMACTNQGYFVHLSTLSEVKEKVLEYIPVMARPRVLRKEHPIIWTPVYADVVDPKMTDWLWDNKESSDQKEIFLESQKMSEKHITAEETIQKYLAKRMTDMDDDIDPQTYQFMTSVSMPVLDKRENATKIAYLLGVAGTDVPIKDLQELMMPHKLGVNAYAYLVTNNGHIVMHPDFRPVFQDILKPNYNSVDMSEIEILDNEDEPREENETMNRFREAVIDQLSGNETLAVKYHYDKMKRASTAIRRYYYCGVYNTPFTLVISLPLPYGLYWINAETEISLRRRQHGENLTAYFVDDNWKVHPDWIYCRHHYPAAHIKTPEDEFKFFLNKSMGPNWKWLTKRTITPPELMEQSRTTGKKDKLDETTYFCDRSLFQSLVFDGKITASFSKNSSDSSNTEGGEREGFQERFGVTISFVATRSGLTRWRDYVLSDEQNGEKHFSEIHNRAIDEIWYKRAVDYHFIDPHSFVYSIPFDAGDKNGTLVTASYAIFHTKDSDWKAPAAVIGFQFRHSALVSMLKNITSNCSSCSDKSMKTCSSNDLECYVLDNNGYIIVSKSLKETGKFFGEVRSSVMKEMIRRNFFKRIRMFDYQAVCFQPKSTGNCASYFVTPLAHLMWMLEWTVGYLLWMMAQTNLHLLWVGDGVYATDDYVVSSAESEEQVEEEDEETPSNGNNKGNGKPYEKLTINRTRPQPCDKEVYLYQMIPREIRGSNASVSNSKCARFFEAHVIANTNMLLVVVDSLCMVDDTEKLSVIPSEVIYNSSSLACYKVQNRLSRRRPKNCTERVREEIEIKICGGCTSIHLATAVFLFWITMIIASQGH